MSANSIRSFELSQTAFAEAPVSVKSPAIVTLFGKPIVTVSFVTVVSISFAVPENVKVSPVEYASVPVSPAKLIVELTPPICEST